METSPSPDDKQQTSEPPAPETLAPQEDSPQETAAASSADASKEPAKPATPLRARHNAYRPTHKATFIGIGAVVAILAINAGIIMFVLKNQASKDTTVNQAPVTISEGTLDKLGVNRNAVGEKGVELVVNPDSKFNGKLAVGGDVSVAGQLKLSSKFSAADASLTQLEAGKTSLSDLNVNGDGTISTLNLRKDLQVVGNTRLQGDVTLSRILTVNNSANVAGNLAVGGTLTGSALQTRTLTVTSTINLGGRIVTSGGLPAASPGGSALGSNGTISVSGNDSAGTVAVNAGINATSGILAAVTFHNAFNSPPHVAIGASAPGIYISRSLTGFTLSVDHALPPGGYVIDYVIMQ